jgi:hypothetical protein
MRAYRQATVWGAHRGVGRAGDGDGWYPSLLQWWAARQEAHRRAAQAALELRWDPQRETVQPQHADAALDCARARGTRSLPTMLDACMG